MASWVLLPAGRVCSWDGLTLTGILFCVSHIAVIDEIVKTPLTKQLEPEEPSNSSRRPHPTSLCSATFPKGAGPIRPRCARPPSPKGSRPHPTSLRSATFPKGGRPHPTSLRSATFPKGEGKGGLSSPALRPPAPRGRGACRWDAPARSPRCRSRRGIRWGCTVRSGRRGCPGRAGAHWADMPRA